ncbi:hypothetical protein EJ066_08075 [Mesorhizobium sp. M9A.F.Ca.ET.002.03.1.2]|uniref:hypothetical protein n=1 Tax=Mesorhizobium sp. M9A.F.Ca.ET.002.03.1.2 TaxID=2493668 RepID=UPI000F75D978|nr:hypothetical protein [Mesorhizobium sp. M9A.F.Ca.ET.002.03.1.2]AZN97250.1 hypothetical protein EJ066_08075 [Mesorhizobium sp. M9A.F.Ca.ET.002.03.1.2]
MPDLAAIAVGIVAVVAILSALLPRLWNITIPDGSGLVTIRFGQTLKRPFIAGIWFGSPSAIDYRSDERAVAASQPGV